MNELPSNALIALPEDIGNDPLASPLLKRAVDMAARIDASLLLLKICYDHSLSYGAFAPRAVIDQARLKILEAENARLESVRSALADAASIDVSTALRWGYDRSAEILRAARACQADLIMKQRGDQSFVLGLFSTTDWELLRDASMPVWFVPSEARLTPSDGVIAAIDQTGDGDDADTSFRLDNQVFNYARHLSAAYAAPLHVVHAYSVPKGLGYDDYLPTLTPDANIGPPSAAADLANFDADARREIARRHGKAIQAFVNEQGIPPEDIIVVEGPVDAVMKVTAEEKHAGLIVMGATQRNRWDRLMGRVNAEPTLDRSPCDILFVKRTSPGPR